MSNAISLTVPVDNEEALVAAANMLMDIAGRSFSDVSVVVNNSDVEARTPASQGGAMFTEEEQQQPITTLPPNVGDVNPAAVFGAGQQEQAPTTDVELDTDGLPWDARIHSGSKKKNDDGRWKKKRGVDDEIKQQVETELRAVAGTPPTGVQQPGTPPTGVQQPGTPPAGVQQPGTPPTDFNSFLRACSGLMQQGSITMPRITEILNGHGIGGMNEMGNRADLIPVVWADIEGLANNG